MKKFLLVVSMVLTSLIGFAETEKSTENSSKDAARVEVVNDSVAVYYNIDRLDVIQKKDRMVYVVDTNTSAVVAMQKGSFSIELPKGNYIITTTQCQLKAAAKNIVEYSTIY